MTGGRIWVERSGGSFRFARLLPKLFPQAKFVFLYRYGRDVALSAQKFAAQWPMIRIWTLLRHFGFDPLNGDHPAGRSRMLAVQEAYLSRLIPLRWSVTYPPSLKACAQFWSAMTLRGLNEFMKIPAERRHILHYEQLTTAPAEEIAKLIDFLGVDAPPDWLTQASRLPEQRPPRWEGLPDEEQRALSDWTAEARSAVDTLE